tara:strand:+ start:3044 stop:3316 length:273 start_codon:yes stop_codon:yes gene_type:complete
MQYFITRTILDQASYIVAKANPELNQSTVNKEIAALIQLQISEICDPICEAATEELAEQGIETESDSGQLLLGTAIQNHLLAYEWTERPE